MRGIVWGLKSLRRQRLRTALSLAGIAVAAAMLLDMVMLSGGIDKSFADLLLGRGYQMRLTPKGTLPFDTEATMAEAGYDGERAAEAHMAWRETCAALSTLPEDQRSVIALVLVDGMTYRDAADVLGVPIGTVTSRLARGRETLAARIFGSTAELR